MAYTRGRDELVAVTGEIPFLTDAREGRDLRLWRTELAFRLTG